MRAVFVFGKMKLDKLDVLDILDVLDRKLFQNFQNFQYFQNPTISPKRCLWRIAALFPTSAGLPRRA